MEPLPPPSIPPPRTPPSPPGLSRLGNSTIQQVTAKAWRFCHSTTEKFFKLIMLPAHWGELLCSTTPAVTIPQWLETGGSARASFFFSVQRRMAFARSFNMFPIMLHVRLIHSRRGQAVGPQPSTGRGPIHSPIPLSRSQKQEPKHREPKAKQHKKQAQAKTNHTKHKQKNTQPHTSDVTGSSYG